MTRFGVPSIGPSPCAVVLNDTHWADVGVSTLQLVFKCLRGVLAYRACRFAVIARWVGQGLFWEEDLLLVTVGQEWIDISSQCNSELMLEVKTSHE